MGSSTPLEALRFGPGQPLSVDHGAVTTLGRVASHAVWLLLLGVAYAFTARLSQQALFQRSPIGLFWVPNALTLSALLLTSKRWWFRIVVVCASAHLLSMSAANPTWRMAWQIGANGFFVVMTAELLRRRRLPRRFASRHGAFGYFGVVFLTPIILAATSPGFVRSVIGVETLYSPPIAFVRFILSSLSPMLLVTPAILLSADLDAERLKTLRKRDLREGALILGTVIVVGVIAFDANRWLAELPWLLVLTIPPLVLAAIRLGPTGASISLLCIGALSLVGAMREHGPFVLAHDPVLSLHIYWIIVAPSVLLLAAVIREREQVAATLGEQRIRMVHARHGEELRELVGTLAHNLRQPLAAILANTQVVDLMLSRQPVDHSLAREILHDIEEQNRHAAGVVTRLQRSAREAQSSVNSSIAVRADSDVVSLGALPSRTSVRERPLIGILDDDRSVRVALARLCRVHGLDTCEFSNEREFFASLERARPDCLVVDAQMPTINGLDVHRQLRDQKIDMPVILVTGREDDDTRAQATAAGVSAYFCKPVDGDALIAAIASALRTRGTDRTTDP